MSAYKHPPSSALAGIAVSRCIGTCLRTYPPVGGLPPARAKYAEHKRSLCDGCISLPNAEGFVRCFLHLPQLGFRFSFWAYPLSFSARIRAYFSLTTNRLLLFLSALFPYPCPYILQISTIRCSNQIPFSRQIHFHSCLYPLIIN